MFCILIGESNDLAVTGLGTKHIEDAFQESSFSLVELVEPLPRAAISPHRFSG